MLKKTVFVCMLIVCMIVCIIIKNKLRKNYTGLSSEQKWMPFHCQDRYIERSQKEKKTFDKLFFILSYNET